MMALGIGPGDEVITSTYSFFATAGCVARLGATPRLVDIDPTTYNLVPDARRARRSRPRTRAIIPVHLYGLCADMDPLLAIAEEAGVPVIEDAAQAIGATYQRPPGRVDRHGRLFLVLSEQEPWRVRRRRPGDDQRRGSWRARSGCCGTTARRSATITSRWAGTSVSTRCRRRCCGSSCRTWRGGRSMRRANADRYRQLLRRRRSSSCRVEPYGRFHIYNQFVVAVADRDRVRAALTERGIGTEIYYPVPFHLQECFAGLGYHRGRVPGSRTGGGLDIGAADLRRADRSAAGDGGDRHRRRPRAIDWVAAS